MTAPYELKLLYSQEQINAAVKRLAAAISLDYAGKDPLMLGVLKGSFIFLSDLVRYLTIPVEIDFIGISSYGSGTVSCGEARISAHPAASIHGRHVLVVEDIVDTGICLKALSDFLNSQEPASLKICTLLDKPSRRIEDIEVAYTGLVSPDKFVVGYGLDYSQHYRHLPQIYTLEGKSDEGQLASDD